MIKVSVQEIFTVYSSPPPEPPAALQGVDEPDTLPVPAGHAAMGEFKTAL
jgi:hypothetical protein